MDYDDALVAGVRTHMNADHLDDSLLIVQTRGARPAATAAQVLSLDEAGVWFNVVSPAGAEQVLVGWIESPNSRMDVRRDLVRMVEAAHASTDAPPPQATQ